MPEMQTNVLYCADNLDILRRYLPDSAVDLGGRVSRVPASRA